MKKGEILFHFRSKKSVRWCWRLSRPRLRISKRKVTSSKRLLSKHHRIQSCCRWLMKKTPNTITSWMFLFLPKSSNDGIFLSFQMVLQGCIGPTVNQGPIEVAKVFLGDLLEGNKKEPTNHQKTLRICFKDFKEKWVIVVYIPRAGGRFLAHFKEVAPLEQLLFSSLLGRKKIGT